MTNLSLLPWGIPELFAGFDVIIDYSSRPLGNQDQIDAPSTVTAITLTASSGTAASLTPAAIQAVLTAGVFTANSARAFRVSFQSGTFIAFNDGTAGFDAGTDSILHLQDYFIDSASPVTII